MAETKATPKLVLRIRETFVSIDEQAPTLTYFGLSFWMAWNTVAFSGAFWLLDGTDSLIAENLTLTHLAACVVTLIAIGLFSNKVRGYICKNRVTLFGAFLGVAGSVGIVFSNPDISAALFGFQIDTETRKLWFYASCVLTGVGTTLQFIRAAALFGALPPRQALRRFASCTLVSCCIFFVLKGCPDRLTVALFIALPLFSCFFFCIRFKGKNENRVLSSSAKVKPVFILFLASITLISFTLEAMKAYILIGMPASKTIDIHTLGQFLDIVLCAIVVIVVFLMKNRDRGFVRLYSAIVAVIALAIMFLVAFNVRTTVFSGIAATCTPAYNLVVWAMLAYIIYQSRAEALFIFPLGNAALSLGTILGAIATTALQNGFIDDNAMRVILIILGASVLLDVALVFNEKRLRSLIVPIEEARLASDAFGHKAAEQKTLSRQNTMKELAAAYALTPREEEMLGAMAEGKTAQQIADAKTVSVYTVRAHIRNMYKKLNVHSKAELQDLLEQYEAR